MAQKKKTAKATTAARRSTAADRVEVKDGDVTVQVPAVLSPPAKAGSYSPKELARFPTVRSGAGVVAQDVVDAARRRSDIFDMPRRITAEDLLLAGERAEGYDRVLTAIEAVTERFRQANRIADAELHTLLSRVYDQVKSQAKDEPVLKTEFSSLFAYFKTAPKRPAKKST